MESGGKGESLAEAAGKDEENERAQGHRMNSKVI
jgi:hypothetical protein